MSAADGLHARLSESLGAMLRWRSSAGYSVDTHRYLLSPFVDYVAERWDSEPLVTPEVVDGWLGRHRYESPSSQYCFIACLRGLCRFTRFEGHEDFVPDEAYSVRRADFLPYLLTDDELRALFDALDSRVGRTRGRRLLPELVLPVWSRLLYCCGMRPGEPPSLLRDDVDLATGDVYIRQAKHHRDRHIIVSDDMRDLMARYDALSDAGRARFFERCDGKPYDAGWYGYAWRGALADSGVEWRPDAPRPYDLRHMFCSRTIARWMDEGKDVAALFPVLSAYVGHSHLASTLYYVHLLPDRLRRSPGVDWGLLTAAYGEGAVT